MLFRSRPATLQHQKTISLPISALRALSSSQPCRRLAGTVGEPGKACTSKPGQARTQILDRLWRWNDCAVSSFSGPQSWCPEAFGVLVAFFPVIGFSEQLLPARSSFLPVSSFFPVRSFHPVSWFPPVSCFLAAITRLPVGCEDVCMVSGNLSYDSLGSFGVCVR